MAPLFEFGSLVRVEEGKQIITKKFNLKFLSNQLTFGMNCPKNSESGLFCFHEMNKSEPAAARMFVMTDKRYMQAFMTANTLDTKSNTHLFGIYNSDCNCYEGRSLGYREGEFIAYQGISEAEEMQICFYL
jgi:hypothetical protein